MTDQPTPDSSEESQESPASAAAEPNVANAAGWRGRLSTFISHPKAPIYFLGIVTLCVACVVGVKLAPRLMGSSDIVLFDPVKFMNAQRAAASFLVMGANPDLALSMTQVAKQAEAVIREEARGAVVLVKQAVVVPDGMRDITDDVLIRFGLPTKVPTVTTSTEDMILEDIAPTDSAFSAGAIKEDYRMELEKKALDSAVKREKQTSQESLIP